MSSQINPIKFFLLQHLGDLSPPPPIAGPAVKPEPTLLHFWGRKKRRNEEAATVISVRHAWLDWWWYHGDRTSPVAIREPW